MKREADKETQNLERWIESKSESVIYFRPKKPVGHRALDASSVINGIIDGIKLGQLNAIELGCDLAIANQKIPFGRCLKGNIFNALKGQVRFIDKERRYGLCSLAISYLNHAYPPREGKPLYKLIKRFERAYVDRVVAQVVSNTGEAKKWVNYLNAP